MKSGPAPFARWLAVAVTVVLGACGSSGPPKVAATVVGSAIPSDRVERLTTQWINSQSNQALNDNGVQLDRKWSVGQRGRPVR